MPAQTRPPLGVRAVSDMAPLVSPAPDTQKGEVGRGTHVVQGGVQVTSGKRLVLGGIAPFSPFLPLPPAPTASQVRLRCNLANNVDSNAGEAREADTLSQTELDELALSCRQQPIAAMPRRLTSPESAPFMIRSYSMPVATQRDYDAEQRDLRNGKRQHSCLASSSYTPAWSMSRTNSKFSETEGDAAAPSSFRSPLRTVKQSELNSPPSTMTRALSRSVVNSSSTSNSSNSINTGAVRKWDANNGDANSAASSDEAEVRTPRAISPVVPSDSATSEDEAAVVTDDTYMFRSGSTLIEAGSKSSNNDTLHALAELHIHPDHMQPPPVWSSFVKEKTPSQAYSLALYP